MSDGTQRTTGQVDVLQQGPLDDSVPLVQDDSATVREGDTVSVPVLDNDTMADGIPLQVDPGSVKVVSKGDAQRAFASGNVIRYVPEARGLRGRAVRHHRVRRLRRRDEGPRPDRAGAGGRRCRCRRRSG